MKTTMTKALCLILLASRASALLAQGPSECGTIDNLVVGSDFGGDIGYVPFETNDEGEIVGFDAAVACEVAHRLGFSGVNFRQTPFPTLLTTVAQDVSPIDAVISAVSITDDNLAVPNVAFVKYNDDSLGVVSNVADMENPPFVNATPATILKALNDFGIANNTDVSIGVMPGSRQEDIINAGYSNLAAVPFGPNTRDLEAAITALKNASPVTALFVDGATAVTLAAADPTLFAFNNVVDATNSVPSQGYGIALNANCCQLYVDIQQAIDDMNADGTLARLRAEFIGVPTVFTPVASLAPANCVCASSGADSLESFLVNKYCPNGTPVPPCQPFFPSINSNAVANFIFSKFCACTVGVTVI